MVQQFKVQRLNLAIILWDDVFWRCCKFETQNKDIFIPEQIYFFVKKKKRVTSAEKKKLQTEQKLDLMEYYVTTCIIM